MSDNIYEFKFFQKWNTDTVRQRTVCVHVCPCVSSRGWKLVKKMHHIVFTVKRSHMLISLSEFGNFSWRVLFFAGFIAISPAVLQVKVLPVLVFTSAEWQIAFPFHTFLKLSVKALGTLTEYLFHAFCFFDKVEGAAVLQRWRFHTAWCVRLI